MSAVGKIVGKVFGGDSKPVQGNNYSSQTEAEKTRMDSLETEINRMFGEQGTLANSNLAQSQEIQNLFANNLKQFLTTGGQQTPEQLQQASDFVDQTFTNPTQNVVNQQIADYQSQASAKAAALGRNPNTDIATQQSIAGEGLRQNIGLQAERGSRIQQASKDIYDRGLGALNAGAQGSSFLNQLGQQAFQNRVGLLNARSGLADYYQKERSKTAPAGVSTSPGILGTISSGIGQVAGITGNIGKLGGFM